MRTLKTKTKSFYHVELTEADMLEAIKAYQSALASDDIRVAGKKDAFKKSTTSDCATIAKLSDGKIMDIAHAYVTRWTIYEGATECDWLAHYLGYDGWDNSGYTHTNNVTGDVSVRMTFWNY